MIFAQDMWVNRAFDTGSLAGVAVVFILFFGFLIVKAGKWFKDLSEPVVKSHLELIQTLKENIPRQTSSIDKQTEAVETLLNKTDQQTNTIEKVVIKMDKQAAAVDKLTTKTDELVSKTEQHTGSIEKLSTAIEKRSDLFQGLIESQQQIKKEVEDIDKRLGKKDAPPP